MREERPIMNEQCTVRITTDLLARVDRLANEKLLARGAVIRHWISKCVKDEEYAKK